MPIKVDEHYRTSNRLEQKRKCPLHIIIKILNTETKKQYWKLQRKGQVKYKGRPIRLIANFSMKPSKSRRAWRDALMTLRECIHQSKLLYQTKISIAIDEKNKILHDKAKFKQKLYTNLVQQKALEGKLLIW